MKNLYSTVDIRAVGYSSDEELCTGHVWMYNNGRAQITLVLICDSYDGMSMRTEANKYIISMFSRWISDTFDRDTAKRNRPEKLKKNISYIIKKCNQSMYNGNSDGYNMSASLGILLIAGDRYYIYMLGSCMALRYCRGRSVVYKGNPSRPLGRNESASYKFSCGRVGYADAFLLCTRDDIDGLSMWYMNSYIKGRYRGLRRHRYGITCSDVMDCMIEVLGRRSAVKEYTAAAVCCNLVGRR